MFAQVHREYTPEETSAAERHQLVERALHWRQQGEAERQKWEKEAEQRWQKEVHLRFWEEETGLNRQGDLGAAVEHWLEDDEQPLWEAYKTKQRRYKGQRAEEHWWEDETEEEGEYFLRHWHEKQDEGGIMDSDDYSDYNLHY